MTSTRPAHVYEVRPRKDHRGVDLICDALPFGRLSPAMEAGISDHVRSIDEVIALLWLGFAAAGVVRFLAELADELAVLHGAAARRFNFLAGILADHFRAKHRAH